MLTFSAFIHPSCQLDEKTWKVFQNCARIIFRISLLLTLSKSLYLATGHEKLVKIQQIKSILSKLNLLDEIFGEMAKKSIVLKLNIYLVI